MASPKNGDWYKPKNVFPPLEDLVENKCYAITINPCDKYQHFHSMMRLEKCIDDLDKILADIGCYEYVLYPELSPKGRFHWHGFFVVIDKIRFYSYSIPHLLRCGTVVLKELVDVEEWKKYVHKQDVLHRWINKNTKYFLPIVRPIVYRKNLPGNLPDTLPDYGPKGE